MIFFLLGVGDLPNGTIISLGTYYPSRFTEHREQWTQLTLKIKSNDDSTIDLFVGMLDQIIQADVAIAVVPSSTSGKTDIHGVTRIAKRLASTRRDATGCVVRHKSIEKLAYGGDRSKKVHYESLRIDSVETIRGREVLLIDDVVTSGHSLEVCAELLIRAGAARVNCLAISRTYSGGYFSSSTEATFRRWAAGTLKKATTPEPPAPLITSPYFSAPSPSTTTTLSLGGSSLGGETLPPYPPRSFGVPPFGIQQQSSPSLSLSGRQPSFDAPASKFTSSPAPKPLASSSSSTVSKTVRQRRYILFDFDLTLVNTSTRPYGKFTFSHEELLTFIPYAGIIRTVRRLAKSGRILAVVTSSPKMFCESVLKAWNIKSFSVVIGYHDTSQRKPHPAPVLLALERLGAAPGDAVMVGDSATDIQAGAAAGVMTVGVTWGRNDGLFGADHVVHDVASLLQLLAGLPLNKRDDEEVSSAPTGGFKFSTSSSPTLSLSSGFPSSLPPPKPIPTLPPPMPFQFMSPSSDAPFGGLGASSSTVSFDTSTLVPPSTTTAPPRTTTSPPTQRLRPAPYHPPPPRRLDRSTYRSSVIRRTAIYTCYNGHNTYIDVHGPADPSTQCSQCFGRAYIRNVDEYAY